MTATANRTENRVLYALAEVVARAGNVTRTLAQDLFSLMSASDCPARFLSELATVVGFDDTLRVSGYPQGVDWRRIIDLAPSLWRAKGDHETLRDVVRAFTGARAWIGDWFSFRTVAGTTIWPWFSTFSVAVNGDWWTEVHVEDVDGALDRDLAEDALALVRAGGEVKHLTYAHYVENWDALDRWTDRAAAGWSVSGQELALDSTAGAAWVRETYANGAGYTVQWDHCTYNALFRPGVGDTVRFRCRDDLAADFLEVRITQGSGVSNVLLLRGGVPFSSGTHAVAADPHHTLLSVRTLPLGGGGIEVHVALNGHLVVVGTDPAPPAPGAVEWRVEGGSTLVVEWFEVLPGNAETRTIGG